MTKDLEGLEPAEVAAITAVAEEADQIVEALDTTTTPRIPDSFSKVLHPKKRAFLIALTTTPIISAACLAAKITRPTMYNWLKSDDEDFKVAWKEARELGIHVAEDEAWKRATDGTVEDVYGSLGQNQGTGVVGQRRVKSDTMLIFMLKGAAPEKYRERYEHSGPGGGPIQTITEVRNTIIDPKEGNG